jgi:autotransporter-associated beta strand protein
MGFTQSGRTEKRVCCGSSLFITALTLAIAGPAHAQTLSSLWEFQDAQDIGKATVGVPLAINGTAPEWFESQTYGTVTLQGVVNTLVGPSNFFTATHNIGANGGGNRTNQYTLVYDVKKPTATLWRSFYQTDLANTTDAEFFVRGAGSGVTLNTLGRDDIGYSSGFLSPNIWYRVVVSVDLGNSFDAYRNGTPFANYAVPAVDSPDYSLDPSRVLLFADNDGGNQQLSIGSVAIYDGALTASQAALLGGPGAAYVMRPLTWNGSVGNSSWDTFSTNWVEGTAAVSFLDGDNALFDDTATGKIVDVNGPIVANAMRVSTSSGYSFQGFGRVTAVGGLEKSGAGGLSIALPLEVEQGIRITGGDFNVGDGNASGSFSGEVTLDSSSARLVLDRSDDFTNAGGVGGAGAVVKRGAGTATITGRSTFSGSTTVTAGTLRIGGAFSNAGGVTVASGAGLALEFASSPETVAVPTLALGSGGTALEFSLSSATVPSNALISVASPGGLQLNGGSHTITVASTQGLDVGTFTLIDYDGAAISSGFTLGSLPKRVAGSLVYDTSNTQIDLQVTGIESVRWVGNLSDVWDVGSDVNVGGTQNWITDPGGTATNFVAGDRAVFTDSAAQFSVNLAQSLAPGSVTVNNASQNYTFGGTGRISGTGSLVKSGAGTLTFLTDNTYSGGTTVTAGTLQLGDGGGAGNVIGAVSVASGATVRVQRGTTTIAAGFTGSGNVVFQGTGVTNQSSFTLTGDSSAFSGPMEVHLGRLNTGTNVNALGTGPINVTDGGQVFVTTETFSNPITIAGDGWAQGGTGTKFGALRVFQGATWAGDVTLTANARISGGLSNGTVSGKISGPHRVEFGPAGQAGVVTLTNPSNDYSGGTLIAGGSLLIKAATALSTGPVTITSTVNDSLAFDFGDGSVETVANDVALPALTTATRVFTIRGSPTQPTTVTLSGRISGGSADSILRMGDTAVIGNNNSVLILGNPANTFAGTINVFRGTVGFTSNGALGSVNNDILLDVNGNNGGLRFAADGITLPASRSITLGGSEVIDTQGFSGRIEGIISGNAPTSGLRKAGSGLLTLAAANTYTGPTTVAAGTLAVTSATGEEVALSQALVPFAGATLDLSTVSGGYAVPVAQTLGGSGTVTGSVGLGAGATLSPGDVVGTLTVTQAATLGGGGNYNWQMVDATGTAGEAAAWDLLAIGGPLDITASLADPFRINLWSLSATNPQASGPAANFDPLAAGSWTIARASGGISGFAADKFLIETTAANGTDGFANSLNGGAFRLAQAGNALNLVFTPGTPGAIVIDVPTGTQTQAEAGYPSISAASSVTKTGTGTLVVDAVNTYAGPTSLQAGTIQLAVAEGLATTATTVQTGATLAVASGVTMRAPAVIVDGGTLSASTLVVNATGGIASLAINAGTIASGATVTVAGGGQMALVQDARVTVGVASLEIAETSGGGRLDLGAGQVSIAAGGITAAALRADILAGRNGGAWNGPTGIMSSTAAAAAGGGRAVGYVVAGDGTARVSFAAPGDTDLSGQVNVFDLVAVNSSGTYGSGQPSVWSQGDFTYDGITNVFDLVAVNSAGAYGRGNYFPATPTVTGSGGSVAAVPEPGTLGVPFAALLLGGMIRAGRRGRSSYRDRKAICFFSRGHVADESRHD